jgi:phage head maturation protease
MVEADLIGGMSFAFTVRPDGERWQGNTRQLLCVDLVEISVVSAFPAYGETSVSARSQPRVYRARLFLDTTRKWPAWTY